MRKSLAKLALLSSVLIASPTIMTAEEVVEEKAVYELSPTAPPAEKEEIITKRPGLNYTWIKGRWKFEGKWVWIPGHWAAIPHPDAVWVPGHWLAKPHGYVFVKGHWE